MILDRIAQLFKGRGGSEALAAGTAAPAFTLQDVEGRSYALADALQQGPVLLAFFKTTCPTTQFTFPFLERIYRAMNSNRKAQLWGISQDDARDTRGFAREYECNFPLLLDESGYPVSNQYGLTNVPTLFLVKPDGEIQLASAGFSRADLEAVAEALSPSADQPITVFRPDEIIPDHKPG